MNIFSNNQKADYTQTLHNAGRLYGAGRKPIEKSGNKATRTGKSRRITGDILIAPTNGAAD